jgi:hypothetical protein
MSGGAAVTVGTVPKAAFVAVDDACVYCADEKSVARIGK